MSHPYEILQDKCRSLRLAETAKELPILLREAEAKGWTWGKSEISPKSAIHV
jgi:hypothetical protein